MILIIHHLWEIRAVEFNCMFTRSYKCDVISGTIRTRNEALVTRVYGFHENSRSNQDVLVFDARMVSLSYFPRNLNLYLPKVTTIFVEKGLQDITKEDLRQYPKLLEIYLSDNEIEWIEKDLFIYNPQLQLVFFDRCKIKYVDPNVFDHLNMLVFLGFDNNICDSGHQENNRNGVLNLIQSIKRNCSIKPLQEMELESNIQNLNLSLQIVNLKKEIAELKYNYELCKLGQASD